MAKIAALGEGPRIQAFALAGAEPHPAATPEQVVAEWMAVGPDVAVLIVTATAAEVLARRLAERRDLLVTVLR